MIEFTDSIELTKAALLASLLLFCSATDLSMRRIPNAILLPALMTSLFLNSVAGGLPGLADSIAGLVIGILMLMPLHILGRMGAGDIKLLGVVGSVLGAWGAIVAGFATMMAGGILAVLYLIWLFVKPGVVARLSRLVRFDAVEQGTPGDFLTRQNVRAAEIPYALAIAAGTFATLVYMGPLKGVSIT
jgi:prepilin peptidase CpaA